MPQSHQFATLFTILLTFLNKSPSSEAASLIETNRVERTTCTAVNANSKLDKFFTRYVNWKIKQFPIDSTFNGIDTYADEMGHVSLEHLKQEHIDLLDFLKETHQLLPCYEGINKTNLRILEEELLLQIGAHNYKEIYFPISSIHGIHILLKPVLDRMALETLKDYNTMISKMEKVPQYIDETISLLKAGVSEGYAHHNVSISLVNSTLTKIVNTSAENSAFYKYFSENLPKSFTRADTLSIQTRGLSAVRKILEAFEKLRVYMEKEYKTREKIAITSIPKGGQELYKHYLRVHAAPNVTAKQIHEMGIADVEKIKKEMQKVISELGHTMTLTEFSNMIKNDPKNYYDTAEELLQGYRDIVKFIHPQLKTLFKTIPKTKLIVEPDPNPFQLLARYKSPKYNDTNAVGTFVVGTHNKKSSPKYFMEALTLHEGSPGHHHQIAFIMESEIAPLFRRLFMGRHHFTGFVEGYALYTETLGEELGLYKDKMQKYGQLMFAIWRACRQVVDTGMHALGWTRDQAIEYMAEHLAMDRKTITQEIDRYLTWPGQAVGYKYGELKIQSLKAEAKKDLKESFDIKEFHEVILNAAGPLTIVEQEVKNWIKATLVAQNV